MVDVILMLRLEHENMRGVLARVEEQISAVGEGRAYDRNLIASVVEYCVSYQDRCHHPKEELVYRQLAMRDRAAAAGIRDLMEQHDRLRHAVARLADCIDVEFRGPGEGRDQLFRAGLEFLSLQNRHMSLEEARFFPAALRHLSKEDWEEIDFTVFDGAEPLFDDSQERHFRALRRSILEDHRAVV